MIALRKRIGSAQTANAMTDQTLIENASGFPRTLTRKYATTRSGISSDAVVLEEAKIPEGFAVQRRFQCT